MKEVLWDIKYLDLHALVSKIISIFIPTEIKVAREISNVTYF